MTAIALAHLPDRALIRVSGPDAAHFLQNLMTADIGDTDRNGAGFGALLTPQGKILFDFLVYKSGDAYLLDAPEAAAAELSKRLSFYRLRAKVEVEQLPAETGVFAAWNGAIEVPGALLTVIDPRLEALGQRIVGPVTQLSDAAGASLTDMAAYDAHRIGLGIPEGLKDYDYSDIFPHDADLDQLGGVSFKKGCFVGQEVVARMQHRGTARKRFVQVESTTALPEKGTGITAQGKPVGTLGSSAALNGRTAGLALLRLDKVVQAKEKGSLLECGGAELQVSLPEWAGFSWPEASAAD
ncbi:folate-binding protein [Roseibium aggregatum]|uniref:CAF17-like 4Fe-4S cluster assembly/insertion protein YgfZ n=1 Tax=Roseibium aggregatum TaxID=187304 RepID=UPI002E2B49A4|nr:folate-binding protein [Roseibium aggregatum]